MTVAATLMPKQAPVIPDIVLNTMACPGGAGRHHFTIIVGVDTGPANADRITPWNKGSWSELHPTASSNAYVKSLMSECTHCGWLCSTEGSV